MFFCCLKHMVDLNWIGRDGICVTYYSTTRSSFDFDICDNTICSYCMPNILDFSICVSLINITWMFWLVLNTMYFSCSLFLNYRPPIESQETTLFKMSCTLLQNCMKFRWLKSVFLFLFQFETKKFIIDVYPCYFSRATAN